MVRVRVCAIPIRHAHTAAASGEIFNNGDEHNDDGDKYRTTDDSGRTVSLEWCRWRRTFCLKTVSLWEASVRSLAPACIILSYITYLRAYCHRGDNNRTVIMITIIIRSIEKKCIFQTIFHVVYAHVLYVYVYLFFPPVSNRLDDVARPTAGETILITNNNGSRCKYNAVYFSQQKIKQ